MCIALISSAHPDYPLIIIDNRDEYLRRPTAPAAFWDPPHSNVLGGRDLYRSVRGTWFGVTLQGRVAVLTNFRDDVQQPLAPVSRGEMVNAFLTRPPPPLRRPSSPIAGSTPPPVHSSGDTEAFVRQLVSGERAKGSGGFSLVCGRIGEKLAVVSNRTTAADEVAWIGGPDRETVGLSNAAFGDRSWEKVVRGEAKLKELVQRSFEGGFGRDRLVEQLFEILDEDTMTACKKDGGWPEGHAAVKRTIRVPLFDQDEMDRRTKRGHDTQNENVQVDPATSGLYATQKQTVLLADKEGRVYFVEKTLFDGCGTSLVGRDSVRSFEFQVRA